MMSVLQIIDITQDEENEDFGTLPDDAFLQIQLPKNQQKPQNPRGIIKKPYNK